jgi:hypothetical protein
MTAFGGEADLAILQGHPAEAMHPWIAADDVRLVVGRAHQREPLTSPQSN